MAHIYNSQLDAFDLYHQTLESQRSAGSSLFSSSKAGKALPALGHALAGSTGAAISNLCTYPLDLIITRLQIQHQLRKDKSTPGKAEYDGVQDAARKIYELEGGVTAFYTGVWQDTGKTIADSFLFFLAYNFLRRRRIAARSAGSESVAGALPALDELAVGFVAGSFTKLLTTPIANIVTRKQAAALVSAQASSSPSTSSSPPQPEADSSKKRGSGSRPPSTAQIAQDIMSRKGVLGFWSGYSASLILTLNPSLTFFLYETFKRLLPRSRRDNPPPTATFLMAAVSKACASTVTYPFSLAKARAQAGGHSEEGETKGESKANSPALSSSSSERSQKGSRRTTIFNTLLRIAQTEGMQALYEGLVLEIVKAFFSHGITMLVKQAVHRLIIKIYYLLSIVLSQTARRRNRRRRARDASYEYYDLARARVDERVAATTTTTIEGSLVDGMAGGMVGAALDKANETAELVADYVEEEAEEWRNLYGTGLARWFEEK